MLVVCLLTGALLGAAPVPAHATGAGDTVLRLYVPDAAQDGVEVLDAATGDHVAAVPVGTDPLSVAASLDGTRVYVGSYTHDGDYIFDTEVRGIDTATNAVVSEIEVDGSPKDLAVSPDGATVVVLSGDGDVYGGEETGSLHVVDIATNTVSKSVELDCLPYRLALSPDGGTAYVGCLYDDSVWAIDTVGGAITGSVSVPGNPRGMDIAPDGETLYVAVSNPDRVMYLDSATLAVLGSVLTGQGTEDVAVTPDGNTLLAANFSSYTVLAIDTATRTITGTTRVGKGPSDIKVTADGHSAYIVSALGSDGISVLDIATHTVSGTIQPAGNSLHRLALAEAPLPTADLAVGLTAKAPLLGSAIDYTATVNNNGPHTLETGTVQITLPTQVISVSGLPPVCTADLAANRITCAVSDLPASGSTELAFRAHLSLLTVGLSLTGTAERASSQPQDPSPVNDSDTATCAALTNLVVVC
ncbi:DUF11 domain-containing protein [Streptomyces sp. SM11]|uniref:YVTN family beta-propeller repeat protein n=1 Tax=Streptomyces sp. SM11 TaxID=565557 RepID=UPI000CD4DAB9|nr:DUF11 domain-containing protein [Streptomyces sp. SM11]